MPDLPIVGKALTSPTGLGLEDYYIAGAPLTSLDGTAFYAGGHVTGLVAEGTLDANGNATADLPYSTAEGAYFILTIPRVGLEIRFEFLASDNPATLAQRAKLFRQRHPTGDTTFTYEPVPGGAGPQGVQGISEVDVYAVTDNVGGNPVAPAVAVGGTINVATLTVTANPPNWSRAIIAAAAGQTGWFSRTYVNPATQEGDIQPVWSGPGELGGQGPPGRSVTGDPGDKGWSPLLSAPMSGERVVHRVSGYTGGTGDRPPAGRYLGPLGEVDTAALATDVRGLQGREGDPGPRGFPGVVDDLPTWVTDDDVDIPNEKIAANIARDSEIPSEADIENTADARVRAGTEPFARDTSTDIPVGKFDQVATAIDALLGSPDWRTGGTPGTVGRSTFTTNAAVTTESNLGLAINDVILRIGGDSLTVYRRTSDDSPYLTLVGTIEDVTGQVAAAVAALVSPWAIIGNATAVPPGKLSGVLAFARINNAASRVPRNKLPANLREVPAAGVTGQVVKKTDDGYAWGADVSGGGGGGTGHVPRWRYVRGEDTADPISQAGKVFIGFRYIDIFRDSDNVRTSIVDLGAFGYMPADGSSGYVLAPATAFDIAALFSSSSVTARFELVTALPNIGAATFGVQYGLSTTAGQVLTVHFKREVVVTEQLFIPERLSATHRDLHGFSNLPDTSAETYGYAPGGALSPEAEVREIVEEQDAAGNRTLRLVIAKSSPLNSAIAVTIYWKADGETYRSNRSLALSRDATYSSAVDNRYASPVYGASQPFRLTPGVAYTIKWRPAGTTHDLVLHSAAVWAQVADELDLLNLRGELLKEIYEVESLIPSGGGGVGDITTWLAPSPGLTRNIYHRTNINIDTSKTWLHIRFLVGAGGPQLLQYARIAVAELLALPVSTQANNSNIVETSTSSGMFIQPTTDRYNVMSGHLQHYAVGGVQKLIVAHREDGGGDWPFNNIAGISYAWGD